MKVNNHALILLWRGKNLPDYLLEKIGEVLTVNGVTVPELLKATYMDQEGIAQALVRDSGKIIFDVDSVEDETLTAINNAIVYIGERYKSLLSHKQYLGFAVTLSGDVNKANINTSFNVENINENDKALLNAVEILATSNLNNTEITKKYNISKQVLNIITQVYNQHM